MNAVRRSETCPRCGKVFHCGAADAGCDCFDVRLDEPLRQALAQRYERCLCLDCLSALIGGAPIAPSAPP